MNRLQFHKDPTFCATSENLKEFLRILLIDSLRSPFGLPLAVFLRCASVAHSGLHICLILKLLRWREGVLRCASNLPSCLKIRFRGKMATPTFSQMARMTGAALRFKNSH